VLGRPLAFRRGGEIGPALGAARLARLAASGEPAERVCRPPPVTQLVEPDPALAERYRAPLARWRALYARVRELFPPDPCGGAR
jgi:xylulokinase